MQKGQSYLQLATSLFNAHNGARLEWQSVARMVMPKLLRSAWLQENNGDGEHERTCPIATQAGLKLTSAHLNYITPMGFKWFRYASWKRHKKQGFSDADKWYAQATDIAQEELERSNFYTELIAFFLDRVFTGTGLMYCDSNESSHELCFTHIPAGTYAIAENYRHELSTVARKFKLTASQCEEAFGAYGTLTSNMQAALNDSNRRFREEFEIIHLVLPRKEHKNRYRDVKPVDMPYASIYLDATNGEVLLESGYMEMPYVCTRFLRTGNQVYGTSPFLQVYDTIKDKIVFDECFATTAQRIAIPSLLVPPDMVDEVDYRAGGMTVCPTQYLNSPNAFREIAPSADLRYVAEHKQELKDEIEAALFIPLLEVVSRIDRTMSATEANYREQERIMTFTQSFTQCVADLRPLHNRIFAELLRNGKFPEENMPDEILQIQGNDAYLNYPRMAYIGRMAQAFERNQMNGTDTAITKLVQLAQVLQDPQLTMIFDWDVVARETAISAGMPAEYMLSKNAAKKAFDELMQTRQAQMQQDAALQQSQANKNNAEANAAMAKANGF